MSFLKNRIVLGVISLIIALVLAAIAILFIIRGSKPDYVRTLSFNPIYEAEFRYPIDETLANESNAYFLQYDGLGRLSSVEFRSRGEINEINSGVASIEIDYRNDGEYWTFYDKDGNKTNQEDDVWGLRIDRQGDRVLVTYLDREENPTVSDNNIGFEDITLEAGQAALLQYKAPFDGNSDDTIIYQVELEYDQNGFVSNRSYLDSEGNLAPRENAVAVEEIENDENGNPIKIKYYDSDYNPVVNRDVRSTVIEREYDENGNMTMEVSLNNDDEESRRKGQFNYSKVEYEYNDNNNLTKASYYNPKGELVANQLGFATEERSHDDRGNLTSIKYFDVDGEPTRIGRGGHTEVQFEYDEDRNPTKESHFDAEGNLQADLDDGVAVFEADYDENGRLVEERFLGENEELMNRRTDGVAVIRHVYNDEGDEIRTSYFDKDENSKVIGGGTDHIFEYDSSPRLVEEQREKDGEVVEFNGYYLKTYEYDDFGLLTGVRFYDMDSNLVTANSNNTAGENYEYDDRGNKVRDEYLDTEEELTNNNNGFAAIEKEFDERNNLVKVTYLNEEDEPVINRNKGYAAVEYEYDKANNRVNEMYLDVDMEPLSNALGFYGMGYGYSSVGLRTEEFFLDAEKNSLRHPTALINSVTIKYNQLGLPSQITFRDSNNNPKVARNLGYAIHEIDYDKFGRKTEERFLSPSGNLSANFAYFGMGQVAKITYVYDNGRLVDTNYFSPFGFQIG